MKRFIQGEHRGQSTLPPESLDDYVSDTNPVRVVDVFVDELDIYLLKIKSGFSRMAPLGRFQPIVKGSNGSKAACRQCPLSTHSCLSLEAANGQKPTVGGALMFLGKVQVATRGLI